MHRLMVIVFIVSSLHGFANNDAILFKNTRDGFIKFEEVNRKVFVISAFNISVVDKNNLVNKNNFYDSCSDATVYKGNIILATASGLKIYNPDDNTLLPFFSDEIHAEVNNVAVDKLGRLWFSEKLSGCYMMADNNKIFKKVDAPFIYSLAATPDSNVWVGTNIGMFKMPPTGTEVFRYVEEGLEGYELPDNLVEKIFADNNSNIWAVTSGYLSFIPSSDFQGEIPNYNYVGNRQNIVYDICKIPVSPRSYLFSTSEGVIYTADITGDQYNHTGEIHQVFNERALSINNKLLRKPDVLLSDTVIAVKMIDKKVYFITKNGFWSVSSKDFISDLRKNF